MTVSRRFALGLVAAATLTATTAMAQDKVLNLYSARHYQTDEGMYEAFTRTTGIKINRVDADDAGILARLRAEGAASPADVVMLVDAARLAVADSQGLFQPIKSARLDAAIPANLRAAATPDGVTWTGFSTRARVIVYDPKRVKAEDVATYEQLDDPKLKGMICTRSGSHPYNLSLFATVVERIGDQKGEAWLKGIVDNMARAPKGGDTDQIRGVASGECGVAITNTYYFARLLKSNNPDDRAVTDKVRVVFPNQATSGTHLNIAGAAVAKNAKNRDNAIQFMEFLSSPFAQDYFANGNNEFAAAKGVKVDNPALKAMGGDNFKAETVPLAAVAKNLTKVQQMLDRVGFK
ncbi:MAG: extracellular solute-binding protein [Hydrogenophaga sp.]|nr:extracellular solute-binding protein [Hydrogenophaga sp.]